MEGAPMTAGHRTGGPRFVIGLFIEMILDPHGQLLDADTLDLTAEIDALIIRRRDLSPTVAQQLRAIAAVVQSHMAAGSVEET
jgi:hypothetical protein